jgi:hypothetical protein
MKRYLAEGGNPYEGMEGDGGEILQWIYMGVLDDEVGLRAELVRSIDEGWVNHGVEWHVRQSHGSDDQPSHVCGMFGKDSCYISMIEPSSKIQPAISSQMHELHILGKNLVKIYEGGGNDAAYASLERHWEKWR